MKTIWKTVLRAEVQQTIKIPQGAQFIAAREQHEKMCVWYICDPEAPMVERHILILGTGHVILPDTGNLSPIGCAMLEDGAEVYHIFEEL